MKIFLESLLLLATATNLIVRISNGGAQPSVSTRSYAFLVVSVGTTPR